MSEQQMIVLPYTPFERQAVFHACRADEVLFGGAAGPGKSVALLQEMLHQALEQRDVEVILFRRMYPQLENTLIKWSLVGAPGPGRPGKFPLGYYNAARHTWYFPNGSRLRFGHAQYEDTIREYQGQQFEGLGFDELTEWGEGSYRFALRLLRTTNPAAWPRVRSATNPIGPGFDWVKSRFVNPYLNGTLDPDEVFLPDPDDDDPSPMTRAYIPATHRDNPVLVETDPGYLGRLRQLPKRERIALEMGSWDLPAFEGQLFDPEVIAAMMQGRGFEASRWRCNACQVDWADPTWVRLIDPDPKRPNDKERRGEVMASGTTEWSYEVAYESVPRCKVCDMRLESRRYLTGWDVARKRDFVVGVTVDVTEAPAQIVDFERFRHVPWPQVQARIERRWALYPGRTYVDSTGVGDPLVSGMLRVPVQGVLFTARSKHDLIEALIVAAEHERLKGPPRGRGIEQLWRELSLYQWDDDKLVQDCVMALATIAPELLRIGDLGIS